MRIRDILRAKGSAVATIAPTATVTEFLAELAAHNIGAMVVVAPDDPGVCGIVSERDVVRHLHADGLDVLVRPVVEIMTTEMVTCTPGDRIDDLAALMTNNRVRHIPVLEGGRLAGIVSLGDVVKNRMEELQTEQQQLHAYITQSGS